MKTYRADLEIVPLSSSDKKFMQLSIWPVDRYEEDHPEGQPRRKNIKPILSIEYEGGEYSYRDVKKIGKYLAKKSIRFPHCAIMSINFLTTLTFHESYLEDPEELEKLKAAINSIPRDISELYQH